MAERLPDSLLSDARAFRQQVRLAAVQVAALSEPELAFALAYEVEPFSHVAAAEAGVAWRELPSTDPAIKVYDVAVRKAGRAGARGGAATADGLARFLRPAALVGALLLLAAAADGTWLMRQRASLARRLATQRDLDARVQRVQSAARAATAEAERLRTARAAARRAQDDVAARRLAYPEILRAIAATCGGKTVVRSFASEAAPYTIRLSAVAASAEDAAHVMSALTHAAAAVKWSLTPGPIATSAQGATAEFTCTLAYEGGMP